MLTLKWLSFLFVLSIPKNIIFVLFLLAGLSFWTAAALAYGLVFSSSVFIYLARRHKVFL
ncbi:MAG: hypothetical protein UW81_C0010G0013 [Candidatus Giovannonibacteria bacterium GW2011_GWC2_44_9]|uniref:Uncharacterized protein n=3 Tax=Candidatus Giovannoniibacteriota TaxID=1752738 RepID=A0A0G1LTS5_9BACT|nr:MAG: hypothetical protein UW49_C0016G0018 [Candidatus Giovannonibacteria bacterium GW2011_GWB1_44_23]KKT63114.1 MAG: hypothetical protein UW57_C0010G0003 [Candidatus Giovannonibacteria bacterium GW2011_GWA1_44_29]KKT83824.1 MAG: hypothetical protein UW81_C0010G0013 [Candidatus Giovannonibacteria bacterium GW2011_GWC2_44_9]KKT91334.1 MAG: hypothetical protein UW93_C0008G0013 [Parcubacteria group bacterium GW2011_GWC1_45_13]HBB54073.1 hypothetical protein [Candidatus Nomurabacteria bacterium]